MAIPKRKAAEPFRHTQRELAILNRAHGAMLQHLRDGHRYDVAKRAWVEQDAAKAGTVAAALKAPERPAAALAAKIERMQRLRAENEADFRPPFQNLLPGV